MLNPHTPYVMTDTDSFYVRLCSCGVVHLSFGATVLNLSPKALIAVSETLKEIASKLTPIPVSTEPTTTSQCATKNFDNVIELKLK